MGRGNFANAGCFESALDPRIVLPEGIFEASDAVAACDGDVEKLKKTHLFTSEEMSREVAFLSQLEAQDRLERELRPTAGTASTSVTS
jgi:hypothetical protein